MNEGTFILMDEEVWQHFWMRRMSIMDQGCSVKNAAENEGVAFYSALKVASILLALASGKKRLGE